MNEYATTYGNMKNYEQHIWQKHEKQDRTTIKHETILNTNLKRNMNIYDKNMKIWKNKNRNKNIRKKKTETYTTTYWKNNEEQQWKTTHETIMKHVKHDMNK